MESFSCREKRTSSPYFIECVTSALWDFIVQELQVEPVGLSSAL